MNRRLLLAAGCLALLAVTSGCLGIGTGPVDGERLDSDPAAPYEWESDRTVHITVEENTQFRTVMTTNESTIELFRRDGFGGTNPLSVESVRYRYPNGTVLNGTDIRERGGEVRRTRDETIVELPREDPPDGSALAFTSEGTPKRFTLPTYVEGTYEVVLPPDRGIDFPIFGQVSPGGYETDIDDNGQVHVIWTESVTADTISVRYYLERDLYIFGGIVALVGVIGIGGLFYYRRKIEQLRKQREEMGIDVETDDDEFDDGPPPGMR
ncbi:DUF5803 family protein [Halobellus ordinarius]|uniref:DUF5803 family protein n=1 Tax=Halobellus ordinarius TaxID=3075120 RepID=UPI0028807769|nr:DUF5803 family protein [Halobellus sp. ZY16]